MYEARYWKLLNDGSITCLLCPRSCNIKEGEKGHCFVRKNIDSKMILAAYGKTTGLALDPVEKKPLYHFLPGSKVLSFGTIGCNLACEFCQNWNITKIDDISILATEATPQWIAQSAVENNALSVAFTYNDPVVFMEYAMDTATECHKRNIRTIAVSAGYMNLKPAREFYSVIDAANIDLKSFTDDFYQKITDSSIKPVLKILDYIANHTNVWLEITTLLIPGYNDTETEITELSNWIYNNLGPDIPLHFSAFHPDYHFSQVPATPAETLVRARNIALSRGLKFVYTGNIRIPEGESTYCPSCGKEVIKRKYFQIIETSVTKEGTCSFCNYQIPGVFSNLGSMAASKN